MSNADIRFWTASLLIAGALSGCAAQPAASQASQASQAEQANLASCTAQADAVYQQDNLNGLARTSQNGLLFAPMPDQVFNGQRMGTLNARNNQINDCMDNGNPNHTAAVNAKLPAPQITGTP